MTPQAFVQPGKSELVKLAVHASLGGLSALCLAYNATAFCYRRSPHLAVNSAFYLFVSCWEWSKVKHHMESL